MGCHHIYVYLTNVKCNAPISLLVTIELYKNWIYRTKRLRTFLNLIERIIWCVKIKTFTTDNYDLNKKNLLNMVK